MSLFKCDCEEKIKRLEEKLTQEWLAIDVLTDYLGVDIVSAKALAVKKQNGKK